MVVSPSVTCLFTEKRITPSTQTMSYLAFTYSQEGYNQMSDAVSVCVLVFILVCYTVANRFGADLNKSM